MYDKLYYDYNSEKFFIKNIPTIEHNILDVLTTMNPNTPIYTRTYNDEDYYNIGIAFNANNNKFEISGQGGIDDLTFMVKTTYPLPLLTGREYGMNWGTSNTTKLEGYSFGFIAQYSQGWTFQLSIKASNFGGRTLDKDGLIDFFTAYPTTVIVMKKQEQNGTYAGLDNVYDIVETKILEKPSLETYSPKTYITTNTEIQPSQMTITNKRNLINLRKMKSNTDYTLQLKCNKKGNKPIKINLCGKEKDIDATIGVNHINVTTNELNDNSLELSGEGNIVSEIIVVEGEMNQYPSYFNGVQSTGELQDDGTYKIDVSTNNGGFKNLFDINNFFVNSNNRGELIISSEDNSITSNYTDWYYTVETNIDLKAGKEYLIKLDFEAMAVCTSKYALIMLGDKGYNLNSYNHADFEKIIEYAPNVENKLKTSFNIIYTPSSDKTIYFGLSHGMRVGGSIKIKNIEIAEYNDNLNMDIPLKSHNVAITSNNPLAKGDKLYWNKSNKRYEIDRGGSVEVPTVTGDIIDLPRLYQREDTCLTVSTGNIKPSKIKIDYNDLD